MADQMERELRSLCLLEEIFSWTQKPCSPQAVRQAQDTAMMVMERDSLWNHPEVKDILQDILTQPYGELDEEFPRIWYMPPSEGFSVEDVLFSEPSTMRKKRKRSHQRKLPASPMTALSPRPESCPAPSLEELEERSPALQAGADLILEVKPWLLPEMAGRLEEFSPREGEPQPEEERALIMESPHLPDPKTTADVITSQEFRQVLIQSLLLSPETACLIPDELSADDRVLPPVFPVSPVPLFLPGDKPQMQERLSLGRVELPLPVSSRRRRSRMAHHKSLADLPPVSFTPVTMETASPLSTGGGGGGIWAQRETTGSLWQRWTSVTGRTAAGRWRSLWPWKSPDQLRKLSQRRRNPSQTALRSGQCRHRDRQSPGWW
ncbi:uncharacterized protein KZ484_009406 isoform 2-T5 [Pholidichthys leucotaenia]